MWKFGAIRYEALVLLQAERKKRIFRIACLSHARCFPEFQGNQCRYHTVLRNESLNLARAMGNNLHVIIECVSYFVTRQCSPLRETLCEKPLI